jgi:hypothetical protein
MRKYQAVVLIAVALTLQLDLGTRSSGDSASVGFGIHVARADDDDDGGRDDGRFLEDRGVPEFDGLQRWEFAPDEILVSDLKDAQVEALRLRGFAVIERRALAQLGRSEVRLRIPPRTRLNSALDQVRAMGAGTLADLNHYYRVTAGQCEGEHCAVTALIGWPAEQKCLSDALIGLIDTGIDRDHPSLRRQSIETILMRGPGHRASGRSHGTAIASILIGAPDSSTPGLLPRARLVAIDAFHRAGRSEDRMDAFDLLAAIDALLARNVRIINLSFAGPPNALLERGIKTAHARGVLIVAAAGNDGPRSEPRYPAAYGDVIAVTAVGANLKVYRRAVQGEHIDVSAPGVGIWAADPATRAAQARRHTGTSFAVPFVTAAAALLLAARADRDAAAIRGALLASTRDLGASGHDPVFGHGLIQAADLCASVVSGIR